MGNNPKPWDEMLVTENFISLWLIIRFVPMCIQCASDLIWSLLVTWLGVSIYFNLSLVTKSRGAKSWRKSVISCVCRHWFTCPSVVNSNKLKYVMLGLWLDVNICVEFALWMHSEGDHGNDIYWIQDDRTLTPVILMHNKCLYIRRKTKCGQNMWLELKCVVI